MSAEPGPSAEPLAVARRAAVAQAVRAGEGSPELQRLVRMAARVLRVPVAMVSLIAADREIIESAVGLPEPWASLRYTPLSHSLCAQVVRLGGPVIIFDARQDPAYREHAAVVEMGAGAYAGYPLNHGGHTLGAFCAADFSPRQWSVDDLQLLEDLTETACDELALRIAVQELQDSHERLQQRNARLHEQSRNDAVTGVANRRRFDERLAEEVARLQRQPGVLALVLFRIDAPGAASDDVLPEVAARALTVLRRRTDLLARLGDGEFAVLLPGAGPGDATDMAQRVRDVVGARPVDGSTITVSTGTATYLPSRGATQFYADADAALQADQSARTSGRPPPAPGGAGG